MNRVPTREIVYKVARTEFGRHYSFAVSPANPYCVVYRLQQTAYPMIVPSYLMAFDSLAHTQKYLSAFGKSGTILECQAEVVDDEAGIPFVATAVYHAMRDFWKEEKHRGAAYLPTPEGTRFCNYLIPLRVLSPEN